MGNDVEQLALRGYAFLSFEHSSVISDLAARLSREMPGLGSRWPSANIEEDERVRGIERLSQCAAESQLMAELVRLHSHTFLTLFGPDIDMQAVPHVRVSRPARESDVIHWHRDTFYGNSPWELNLWVPLFPLGEGTGFECLPGSHVVPVKNLRPFHDPNPFRRSVTRGSASNRIGYAYAPKVDDTIEGMSADDVVLLRPRVGQGILFFGSMVHRGVNRSGEIRVSIDFRLRNAHSPTYTKPGYYVPVMRGVIETCAARFLKRTSPSLSLIVPCLNEEGNLENTVNSLVSSLEGTIEDYEILIFDDGSTDQTGRIADRLSGESPRIQVIHHEKNMGLGACYYGGVERATKEYVMTIFGDNEIDPSTLRGLFQRAGETDMVIPYLVNAGIRPWYRRLISTVFTLMVNTIVGRRIRYYNGPVILRRANLLGLRTRSFGFAYMAEIVSILLDQGASFVEVPYTMQTRPSGSPKAFRLKNLVSVARSLTLMLGRRVWGESA